MVLGLGQGRRISERPVCPCQHGGGRDGKAPWEQACCAQGPGCFLFRQGTVTEEFFKGPNNQDIPLKQPLAVV